jgi:hypothetical protein
MKSLEHNSKDEKKLHLVKFNCINYFRSFKMIRRLYFILLISALLVAGRSLRADEPDAQAYQIYFPNVTTETAEIDWISGGDAHDAMMIIRTSAFGGISANYPTDGSTYTAPAYGSGVVSMDDVTTTINGGAVIFCSRDGDGPQVDYPGGTMGFSITVTDLEPGEKYFIGVFEFDDNDGPSGQFDYLLSSRTGNPIELYMVPPDVNVLHATELTHQSFIANWEELEASQCASCNSYQVRIIEKQECGSSSEAEVYDDERATSLGESFTFPDLQANYYYQYSIRAINNTRVGPEETAPYQPVSALPVPNDYTTDDFVYPPQTITYDVETEGQQDGSMIWYKERDNQEYETIVTDGLTDPTDFYNVNVIYACSEDFHEFYAGNVKVCDDDQDYEPQYKFDRYEWSVTGPSTPAYYIQLPSDLPVSTNYVPFAGDDDAIAVQWNDVGGVYTIAFDFTDSYDRHDQGNTGSASREIYVIGAPSFTHNPNDKSACTNEEITFNATATDGYPTELNYQWQVNTGTVWTDINGNSVTGVLGLYSGYYTEQLKVIVTQESMEGYLFRAVVNRDGAPTCYEDYDRASEEAEITHVRLAPVITTQPSNFNVCFDGGASDFQASFTADATGEDLSYQWEVNPGIGWTNVQNYSWSGVTFSGGTTQTLIVDVDAGAANDIDDWLFRMNAISEYCGDVYTLEREVLYNNAPTLTIAWDGDGMICNEDTEILHTTTAGGGDFFIEYNYDHFPFTLLGDGTIGSTDELYSGINSEDLTIEGAFTVNSYTRFRAVGINACGTASSDWLTLTVGIAPTFDVEPWKDPLEVCEWGDGFFYSTVEETAPTNYQWLRSTDNGDTWEELLPGGSGVGLNNEFYWGTTTTNLHVSYCPRDIDGYLFKLYAENTCGNDYSEEIMLEVIYPPIFDVEPEDQEICETLCGETATNFATFTAHAEDGSNDPLTQTTIAYSWTGRADDSSPWQPLSTLLGVCPGEGDYSGESTSELIVTGRYFYNGYEFRVEAYNGQCDPSYAQATLTINSQPSFDDPDVTATSRSGEFVDDDETNPWACEGGWFHLFGHLSPGFLGEDNLSFQWRVRESGGSQYFDIADGGFYTGATTKNLEINDVDESINGSDYQLYIMSDICDGDYATSSSITVTVFTRPENLRGALDQAVCPGAAATFTATFTNDATNTYQWQLNSLPDTDPNFATNWSDILNTPDIFEGATTSKLFVTTDPSIYDPGSYEGYAFRLLASNSCATNVPSAYGTLNVLDDPEITSEPLSQTICYDQGVTFTVEADGDNLTYEWYFEKLLFQGSNGRYHTNSGGTPVKNNIPGATGYETNTLILPTGNGDTYNNYQFTVFVGNNCTSTYSTAATLCVYPEFAAELDPVSVATCPTATAMFTGSFTDMDGAIICDEECNINYWWQYKGTGGNLPTVWTDIPLTNPTFSGVQTTELTVDGYILPYDEFLFRLSAQNCCGSWAYTDQAVLNSGALYIGECVDPIGDYYGCYYDPSLQTGDEVRTPEPINMCGSVSGSGPISYQWQVNTDEDEYTWDEDYNWNDLVDNSTYTDVTTNCLKIFNYTPDMDGYKYRLVATNICGSATFLTEDGTETDPSFLWVQTQPSLTMIDPVFPTCSLVTCENIPITIDVAAESNRDMKFQWLVGDIDADPTDVTDPEDSNAGWAKVTDDNYYSGYTTQELTITADISANFDGNQYILFAGVNDETDDGFFCEWTRSECVTTLYVVPQPSVTVNDAWVCNANATFTAGVNYNYNGYEPYPNPPGTGYNGIWSYTPDDGTTWYDIEEYFTSSTIHYDGTDDTMLRIIGGLNDSDIDGDTFRYTLRTNECGDIYHENILHYTEQPVLGVLTDYICEDEGWKFNSTVTGGGWYVYFVNFTDYSATPNTVTSYSGKIGSYEWSGDPASISLPSVGAFGNYPDGLGYNMYVYQFATSAAATSATSIINDANFTSGSIAGACLSDGEGGTIEFIYKPINIIDPIDALACRGQSATFTGSFTADYPINYRWECSDYNLDDESYGDWYSIMSGMGYYSGYTTTKLTINNVSYNDLHKNKYRLTAEYVDYNCAYSYTPEAELTVLDIDELSIELWPNGIGHRAVVVPDLAEGDEAGKPSRAFTCIESAATFTANLLDSQGGTYDDMNDNPLNTFVWQYCDRDSDPYDALNWNNILTEGNPYTGISTSELRINPVSFDIDGYLYRLCVLNQCGNTCFDDDPGAWGELVVVTAPTMETCDEDHVTCSGTDYSVGVYEICDDDTDSVPMSVTAGTTTSIKEENRNSNLLPEDRYDNYESLYYPIIVWWETDNFNGYENCASNLTGWDWASDFYTGATDLSDFNKHTVNAYVDPDATVSYKAGVYYWVKHQSWPSFGTFDLDGEISNCAPSYSDQTSGHEWCVWTLVPLQPASFTDFSLLNKATCAGNEVSWTVTIDASDGTRNVGWLYNPYLPDAAGTVADPHWDPDGWVAISGLNVPGATSISGESATFPGGGQVDQTFSITAGYEAHLYKFMATVSSECNDLPIDVTDLYPNGQPIISDQETNPVLLTINPAMTVTDDPESVQTCENFYDENCFTGLVAGFNPWYDPITYQWFMDYADDALTPPLPTDPSFDPDWSIEELNDNGWFEVTDPIYYSGMTTTTMCITYKAYECELEPTYCPIPLNNNRYVLRATDPCDSHIFTDVATLHVYGDPDVTCSLGPDVVCVGELIEVEAVVNDYEGVECLSFIWQYKAGSAAWANVNDYPNVAVTYTDDTSTENRIKQTMVLEAAAGMDGWRFRAIVYNGCCLEDSEGETYPMDEIWNLSTATPPVTVNGGIIFGANNGDQTTCYNWPYYCFDQDYGSDLLFTQEVSASEDLNLMWQYYYYCEATDADDSWHDITDLSLNGVAYAGYETTALCIRNNGSPDYGIQQLNGYSFRLWADTELCSPKVSSEVGQALRVYTQPSFIGAWTGNSSDPLFFETYNSLGEVEDAKQQDVSGTGDCITVCEGHDITFFGTVTYLQEDGADIKWQYQPADENDYWEWYEVDLSESMYTAITTTGLCLTECKNLMETRVRLNLYDIPSEYDGYKYRLYAEDGNDCGSLYTDEACINILPQATFSFTSDFPTFENDAIHVCASAESVGFGANTYDSNVGWTWEWGDEEADPLNDDDWSTDFDPFGLNVTVNNTVPTLTIEEPYYSLNGYQFRLTVAYLNDDSECEGNMGVATLYVYQTPIFAQNPQDVEICEYEDGDTWAEFTARVNNTGLTNFRWQYSTNNGTDWTYIDHATNGMDSDDYSVDVPEDLTTAPVQTTLHVKPLYVYDGYDFRAVATNPCELFQPSTSGNLDVIRRPYLGSSVDMVGCGEGSFTVICSVYYDENISQSNVTFKWQIDGTDLDDVDDTWFGTSQKTYLGNYQYRITLPTSGFSSTASGKEFTLVSGYSNEAICETGIDLGEYTAVFTPTVTVQIEDLWNSESGRWSDSNGSYFDCDNSEYEDDPAGYPDIHVVGNYPGTWSEISMNCFNNDAPEDTQVAGNVESAHCVGSAVKYTARSDANPHPEYMMYQWYYSEDNVNWTQLEETPGHWEGVSTSALWVTAYSCCTPWYYSVQVTNDCESVPNGQPLITAKNSALMRVKYIDEAEIVDIADEQTFVGSMCTDVPNEYRVLAQGDAPFNYQWYFELEGNYGDPCAFGDPCSDAYEFSGETTSKLTITGNDDFLNARFHVIVGDFCNEVTSNYMTITEVIYTPEFSIAPVEICEDNDASFEISWINTGTPDNSPFDYTWYASDTYTDNASFFVDGNMLDGGYYSNTDTDELDIAVPNVDTENLDGMYYGVAVEGALGCAPKMSNVEQLTVYQYPRTALDGDQDTDINVCEFDPEFDVVAEVTNDADLTALGQTWTGMWQYAQSSTGPWTDISVKVLEGQFANKFENWTTETLTIKNITQVLDDSYYRFIVDNSCVGPNSSGTVTDPVALNVNAEPVFIADPARALGCYGSPSEFAATTSGNTDAEYSWWYYDGNAGDPDTETIWTEIDGSGDEADFEDYTTTKLTVLDSEDYDNWWFRITAINDCTTDGPVWSDWAQLIASSQPPQFSSFDVDDPICEDLPADITVVHTDGELFYWSYSDDGTAPWTDILESNPDFEGFDSETLTVNDPDDYKDYTFRVIMRNGCDYSQYYTTILTPVYVTPTVTISTDDETEQCSDVADFSFTATLVDEANTHVASAMFSWSVSGELVTEGVTGAMNEFFNYTPNDTYGTFDVQASVTNDCGYDDSNVIPVTVGSLTAGDITATGGDLNGDIYTICNTGSGYALTVDYFADPNTLPTWMHSSDLGESWLPIGYEATLPLPVDAHDGHMLFADFDNGICADQSATVTIVVNYAPTVTISTEDNTSNLCIDALPNVVFTATNDAYDMYGDAADFSWTVNGEQVTVGVSGANYEYLTLAPTVAGTYNVQASATRDLCEITDDNYSNVETVIFGGIESARIDYIDNDVETSVSTGEEDTWEFCYDGEVTLTAVPVGAVPNNNFTYEWWMWNGSVWGQVEGESGNEYTFDPYDNDLYKYYAVVDNGYCSERSGTVTLDVQYAPTITYDGDDTHFDRCYDADAFDILLTW